MDLNHRSLHYQCSALTKLSYMDMNRLALTYDPTEINPRINR